MIKSHKPSARFPQGRWEIIVRLGSKKRVESIHKPAKKTEAAQRELEIKNELRAEIKAEREGSIAIRSMQHKTLRDCLETYVKEKYPQGKDTGPYKMALRYLGDAKIDESFRLRVQTLGEMLKTEPSPKTGKPLKPGSYNLVFGIMSAAINYAYKTHRLKESPVRSWPRINPEPRMRIWTPEEKERLFWVLKSTNSFLYWPVRFLAVSPMRWRSDGIKLTFSENFDSVNNVIYMLAEKTKGKRKAKKAVYHLWYEDEELKEYILGPHQTDYIFEYFGENRQWSHTPLSYQYEWGRVLGAAEIKDFHIHDLKACAITHMMDNGYSFLDLENLGIQFDQRTIQRHYYNYDAMKVVKNVREKCTISMRDDSNSIKFKSKIS